MCKKFISWVVPAGERMGRTAPVAVVFVLIVLLVLASEKTSTI